MESRYAQERVGSSCRAWFASTAANRVRGIVGIVEHLDLDYDRPGHGPGQPSSVVGLPRRGRSCWSCRSRPLATCSLRPTGRSLHLRKDTKGGTPACTGSCAAIWLPLTGSPGARRGLDANGAKQVTYNGKPLYTFKGAKPLSVTGDGAGGVWHVIKVSKSNVTTGA